jgi:protocadherin Fat 4
LPYSFDVFSSVISIYPVDCFNPAQVSEKHRRMQLLDNLYVGSSLWHGGVTSRRAKDKNPQSLSASMSASMSPSSPAKSIHLMFRTVKPNGLLLYAASNEHFTSVELRDGQISYSSLLTSAVHTAGNPEATSLADGRWHNLTLHAQARGLWLYVDGVATGDELDSAGVHDFLDPYLTLLAVGSVRRELYHARDGLPKHFEGCLANFSINDEGQPFNGSGSIFREVVHHGKVHLGCRGPIGVAAATAADPLSVGVTLVIVFFIILLVAILASFVIFRLRRQSKEKTGGAVLGKGAAAVLTGGLGNGLVGGPGDGHVSRHENTYIPDGPELRALGHLGSELVAKKCKERETAGPELRPQRPDIIERELSRSPATRDEQPLPRERERERDRGREADMPEHYDLENASSIAPSDIDVVYHYKGYRDGARKYRASPPPVAGYAGRHKHAAAFPGRAAPGPPHGQAAPAAPKLLQSTPLARLSPSSELSAQQPRILTLHDISGKPLQSALLATTSSSGGVGKDALNSNSERSLNSPIMSQLSGSSASRKALQRPGPEPSAGEPGPRGLTAEEVERLNARPRTSSLVSTLDAVSSSSEAQPRLRRRHSPPVERLERGGDSQQSDESADESFTCSEIEYDSGSHVGDKRSGEGVAPGTGPSPQPSKTSGVPYDGFERSFRGSLSTLVASDDDLSSHVGGLYGPASAECPAASTALSWDYLLNWGPNFESLVGVFIDIAELPDGASRVPPGLRLANNSGSKPSEEYV